MAKTKGPLTKRERNEFMRGFARLVEVNYQKALASGAIDVDMLERGDHTLLKAVVVASANGGCKPLHPKGKAMLANLEHYI